MSMANQHTTWAVKQPAGKLSRWVVHKQGAVQSFIMHRNFWIWPAAKREDVNESFIYWKATMSCAHQYVYEKSASSASIVKAFRSIHTNINNRSCTYMRSQSAFAFAVWYIHDGNIWKLFPTVLLLARLWEKVMSIYFLKNIFFQIQFQWIDWENLTWKPCFLPWNMGFSCKFSLQPRRLHSPHLGNTDIDICAWAGPQKYEWTFCRKGPVW